MKRILFVVLIALEILFSGPIWAGENKESTPTQDAPKNVTEASPAMKVDCGGAIWVLILDENQVWQPVDCDDPHLKDIPTKAE